MARNARDHGGGLDAAIAHYGGTRSDWIDLSTGINPRPFSVSRLDGTAWTALPDDAANARLIKAARSFWNVPGDAAILAVPGCSSAIAQIPFLTASGIAEISGPTYNEHAASFAQAGWTESEQPNVAQARVIVHPNNPTGHFHEAPAPADLTIIDESFCDVAPHRSMIDLAAEPGHLILKSFGKFWGLAGVRLGFVIGDPDLISDLAKRLGPWPVSGIALTLGASALEDTAWAEKTRGWLMRQTLAMDGEMGRIGAIPIGEVSLFRTYDVANAKGLQDQLAAHYIWSRIFPYSKTWIRLGVPTDTALVRLKGAL